MRKKFISFLFMSLMTFYFASAQNYMIEVKDDKKIVHPEQIGLPSSTKAEQILQFIPELLNRHGDFVMSQYDLQVEGVSVGDMRDVVLTQTTLDDILEIEISESPISSYHNNGQGGSINIKLKPSENGFSGNVSLDAQYQYDVAPSAQFNYKNDKLLFRGIMSFEGYFPDDIEVETINKGISTKQSTDKDFMSEMARIYLDYNFNDHSYLKCRLHENYTSINTDIKNAGVKTENSNDATNLLAKFEYKNVFERKSHIQIEACYNYLPKTSSQYLAGRNWDADDKEHKVSGKVEFCYPLIDHSKPNKADFFLGSNMNYSNSNSLSDDSFDYESNIWKTDLDMTGKSLNIAPYFQTECKFGVFSLKTIFEYQYFHYNLNSNFKYNFEAQKDDFSKTRHDFTGKIMLGWQVVDHQHLRLMLDRKLEQPNNEQIYPHLLYRSNENALVFGNEYLDPMLSHEIALDYISDYDFNDNYITLNAGLCYIRTEGIIKMKSIEKTSYSYLTFDNDGNSDILKGLLMLYYRRGVFSVSLTANIFDTKDSDADDNSVFGNISVLPALSFQSGWNASLGCTYNSSIERGDSKIGDCAFAQFRVGKSWKKFDLHAYGVLPLNGHTENTKGDELTRYYLVRPGAGIGFRYKF